MNNSQIFVNNGQFFVNYINKILDQKFIENSSNNKLYCQSIANLRLYFKTLVFGSFFSYKIQETTADYYSYHC